MSAAAPPLPPPNHHLANGYTPQHESIPRTTIAMPPPRDAPGSVQRKPYAHLQDLVANANATNANYTNTTIDKLLATARVHLKQAQTSLDFQRLDYAYVDYITAYNIVTSSLPGHRDYPRLRDRPTLKETQRQLIQDINELQPRFQTVHDIIVEDNKRNGTFPARTNQPSPQPRTVEQSRNNGASQNTSFGGLPAAPQHAPSSTASVKSRPPVLRKPTSLHGTALSNAQDASSTKEGISARFALLRTGNNGLEKNTNTRGADVYSMNEATPSSKSNGPTLHLNTNGFGHISEAAVKSGSQTESYLNKDLPKVPSPTYSPGRGNGTPIQPPRSARNSAQYTVGSAASYTSTGPPSITTSASGSDNPRNSIPASIRSVDATTIERPAQQQRRKSMHMPNETEISATTLYDFLKIYNVLLIDVRSRTEYDEGHIFTQNGICIEPIALRDGMSAEELREALIVSPDHEDSLFARRDEFDLIVYHDQSSKSTNFLQPGRTSTNVYLKYLHDALYEFNQEKPLQYPPIFLIGGIDAWTELLGPQALKSSNTAAKTKVVKPGRPIARRPAPTPNGRLNVSKRRLRDYAPMAPAEEAKWREKVRSESYVLDSQPQIEERLDEEDENLESYAKNYEDFYRRFPDLATVERQSMTTPTPHVPSYPPPPPPHQSQPISPPRHQPPPIPQSPSRPPPIAQRPSYSGVSERAVSQNVGQKTIHPGLPQYIPPKLKRLPRTGLYNFGATCYMNATIQCLSAALPLTAFFLDGRFDKYVQKDNWKGSKGIMPELYTNLLRNLWQPNGVDTIRPTNFKKLCARLNKEWASDRQQDAKEFLDFLVDVLHEDLNVNWNRTPLRQLTDAEESQRERTPSFIASMKEWSRFEHRDHSRLTDLFAGQHISRLQCTTCRHVSTTYEPFYSISVEIPQPVSKNRPVTLDDCLRSYCQNEMLSGEDVWRCPHCNASREATKRITISRAPEFLILHFKRFSASQGHSASKLHTPVEFPLTDFDLEPYMLPAPSPSERDVITKQYGEEALREVPRSMQKPYRYDAYAVMRHLGVSMGSGHYIGLVRDAARGCWREFNDERISDFEPGALPWERRLQNEMAYIVFYQRVAV